MHPTNSQTLYATGWDRIRTNQESTITGPNSRIFKTTNGGATWDTLTNGLPSAEWSRVGISISESNPDHLVAIYVDDTLNLGGIYETFDAGSSWTPLPDITPLANIYNGFGWYFAQIRINPYNDQEYTVLGVDMATTRDGGQTWIATTPPWWTYEVHADKHDLIFYGPEKSLLATDGGLYRSVDTMATWTDAEDIPNTQFYRVAYNAGTLDITRVVRKTNGTTTGNHTGLDLWTRDHGGDGFQALFDYENAGVRYAETQNGNLVFSTGSFFQSFNGGIDSE